MQGRCFNVIPSQMLKGTLEGCILAVVSRHETYGYEISQQLQRYGFGKITEGTICLDWKKTDGFKLFSALPSLGPNESTTF